MTPPRVCPDSPPSRPACVAAVKPAEAEIVLVNDATGGVGSYAVQLVTARGAARGGDRPSRRGGGPRPQARRRRRRGLDRRDLADAVRALHPDSIAAIIDRVNRDRNVSPRSPPDC
jgi:hypothetical protein